MTALLAADLPPELTGRYEPLAVLGTGAFGRVLKCRDRELARVVAVKLLHHALDPQWIERFRREALALAGIKHPNVVTVYSHAQTPAGPYLVMEYLNGRPLSSLVGGAEALESMLQVAEGLEAIHRAGVIHRDLKPSNVLLTAEGRAVLVDFGVARDADWRSITDSRMVVGTVSTMSPEMVCGEPVGPAADWYSWGATLYMICEGKAPFSLQQILLQRTGLVPPPPEFVSLSPQSATALVIRACLARDPLARPSRVAALRALVDEAGTRTTRVLGAPPRVGEARRPTRLQGAAGLGIRPFMAGAVGLGLVGGLALGIPRRPTAVPPPVATRPPDPSAWPAGLENEVLAELVPAGSFDGERRLSDPVDHPEWDSDRPSLARVRAWARAGGKPETLSPTVREALARADAACRARHQPGPFVALLLPTAAAPPRPAPLWLSGPAAELGIRIERVGGWLGAAVDLLERLEHGWGRAIGRLLMGRTPEARGISVALDGFLPAAASLAPETALRASLSSPEMRTEIAGWLLPMNELYEAAIYACARAVAEDPEQPEYRELAALALADRLSTLRLCGFGPATFLEPGERILVSSPEPAFAYLLAWIQHTTAELRHRPGLDRDFPELHQRELTAWIPALVCPVTPSRAARRRVEEAVDWSVQTAQRLHRSADVIWIWGRMGPARDCLGPQAGRQLARRVLEAAGALGSGALPEAEREELRRLVRED